jgi:acetoin utilization deacetylase AcuC-like enzyme
MALAPPRRLVVFLEGGYDLDALRDSTAATVSTLLGRPERLEPATAHGPGRPVVGAARDLHLNGV